MSVVRYTQFNKCKYEKNFYAKLLLACRTSGLKIGSFTSFLFQKLSYFLNLDVILQSRKMPENKSNHYILFYHNMELPVENNFSCLYFGIRKKIGR